jgi:hypothetical protein
VQIGITSEEAMIKPPAMTGLGTGVVIPHPTISDGVMMIPHPGITTGTTMLKHPYVTHTMTMKVAMSRLHLSLNNLV